MFNSFMKGDFVVEDVYDMKLEAYERTKAEYDDFESWSSEYQGCTPEEYYDNLMGDLKPGRQFAAIEYKGNDEVVVIPDGITDLVQNLFANNKVIKSVAFPDSLERICDGAFRGCTALEEVNFGKASE